MPDKKQSIIMGGAVYAGLSVVVSLLFGQAGLGQALGCLIIFSGGLTAVWHYTSTHSLTIKAGQGAGLGTLASLLGAVLAIAVGFALVTAGIMPDPAVEGMERAIADMEARGMTEEQIEQGLAMTEMFMNPAVWITMGLVFGAIGGAISGAVGALIFKKGEDEDGVV